MIRSPDEIVTPLHVNASTVSETNCLEHLPELGKAASPLARASRNGDGLTNGLVWEEVAAAAEMGKVSSNSSACGYRPLPRRHESDCRISSSFLSDFVEKDGIRQNRNIAGTLCGAGGYGQVETSGS
jgi:hypothetical protein